SVRLIELPQVSKGSSSPRRAVFFLAENHRALLKGGADSVSASCSKGMLRSCGTNVPRICYMRNMRCRHEPVPIGVSSMPQPQSLSRPSFFRHLLCPSCLTPMHVRLAGVAAGKERIQFVCDRCGTEAERNTKSSARHWGYLKCAYDSGKTL